MTLVKEVVLFRDVRFQLHNNQQSRSVIHVVVRKGVKKLKMICKSLVLRGRMAHNSLKSLNLCTKVVQMTKKKSWWFGSCQNRHLNISGATPSVSWWFPNWQFLVCCFCILYISTNNCAFILLITKKKRKCLYKISEREIYHVQLKARELPVPSLPGIETNEQKVCQCHP